MNRIKEFRKKKNLLQSDIAKIMKVAPSCIGNWEKEYRNPNIKQAIQLAEILETTVENLYK